MKPHKLAVVGLGVGNAFIEVIRRMPDVELVALCDTDEKKLAAVAGANQIRRTFTRYEDLIKTDVDIVLLATPIQVHGEQSIAALEAGKHVLCEYIACNNPADAEALLKAREKTGACYMFIESDCYERRNRVLIELGRRGVFGKPTLGRGHYLHDCKFMGRHPDGSLTWRGQLWMESPGGGFVAVHTAMPLLEIFGERVVEVYAYGPGAHTMPEYQLNDRVTTVGRLSSGRIIEMVTDILSWRPLCAGYCLQGTRGCFDFDRAAIVKDSRLSDWKNLDQLEQEYGIVKIEDCDGHGSAWELCLRAFLDALNKGSRPPEDLHDALHITAIGWAANESLVSGKTVKVRQYD